MRKTLFGVIITLVVLFTWKYCGDDDGSRELLREHSTLIEKELKQVGKLIVTEGHFSEVYNYENSKEILGNYLNDEKKALVVVNAEVTVAYDLSLIEYEIDEVEKTLKIISIPEAEIKGNPDLEYYDVQSDFLNPFEAADYNAIKESIRASLMQKFEASKLRANAKDRLISELSKFFILTNSLNWTLIHEQNPILSLEQLQNIKL